MAEKHIGQTNGAFTVHYPCGRLTLCLETFFPVTQKKARQLFRLMKENRGRKSKYRSCLCTYTDGQNACRRNPPEQRNAAGRTPLFCLRSQAYL